MTVGVSNQACIEQHDVLGQRHRRPRARGARKHFDKLMRRIERAEQCGDRRCAKRLRRLALRSFDARLTATYEANRRVRIRYRQTRETILRTAAEIDCWTFSDEAVFVRSEPKTDGSNRPVCRFGLADRARQILVSKILRTSFAPKPNQLLFQGGREAAARAVQIAIANGYRYAIELDIKNCFPSFSDARATEILSRKIPGKVVSAVLMASSVCRKVAWKDVPPILRSKFLEQIRRGLPQGSIASPLVAEMLISEVLSVSDLRGLPSRVLLVIYADNILVLAHSAEDAERTAYLLGLAFTAGHVGSLNLRSKGMRRVGHGFDFLGYNFRIRNGRPIVVASKRTRHRFVQKLADLRSADEWTRQKMRTLVGAWCASMAQWSWARPWANYVVAEIERGRALSAIKRDADAFLTDLYRARLGCILGF